MDNLSEVGVNRSMTNLTAERLRAVWHYDPETGVFTRLSTGKPRVCPAGERYLRIYFDGVRYKAHRLAFFYMTGAWPPDQIDHADRAKTSNRWSNLRPTTNGENQINSGVSRNNKLGLRGVSVHHRGKKYVARPRGRKIGRQLFDTPEEAAAVYREAARELYGEFAL